MNNIHALYHSVNYFFSIEIAVLLSMKKEPISMEKETFSL